MNFNFTTCDNVAVTGSFSVVPLNYPEINGQAILDGTIFYSPFSPNTANLASSLYKVEYNTKKVANTWYIQTTGSAFTLVSGSNVTNSSSVTFNLSDHCSNPLAVQNVEIKPVNKSVMYGQSFISQESVFYNADNNGQLIVSLFIQPYTVILHGKIKDTAFTILPSGSSCYASNVIVSSQNCSPIITPQNSAFYAYPVQISDARYMRSGSASGNSMPDITDDSVNHFVGINNPTPKAALDVNGDLLVSGYYSGFIINTSSQAGAQSNFIGYLAGQSSNIAQSSNFIGFRAGYLTTNTNFSNFIGYNAGDGATNANYSNFLGDNAGYTSINANYSNFIGYSAGNNSPNANNSIFIGKSAGQTDTVNNTGGKSSILIGDYSSTGGNSDSIAIGKGTKNSTSGQLNIGNVIFASNIYSGSSATSTPQTIGRVGIGINNPVNTLDVLGNVSCSVVTASLFKGTASYANSASYSQMALSASYAHSAPVSLSPWTSDIDAAGHNLNNAAQGTFGTAAIFGDGQESLHIGVRGTLAGNNTIAIGTDTTVFSDDGIAIGRYATAYGYASIAVGYNASSHDYAIVIGEGSNSNSHPYSMVFGYYGYVTYDNTIQFSNTDGTYGRPVGSYGYAQLDIHGGIADFAMNNLMLQGVQQGYGSPPTIFTNYLLYVDLNNGQLYIT